MSRDQHANLGKVLRFLGEWDRADRTLRSRMLKTFVCENTGKSWCEVELQFAQVSSLFLARVSTWMRLTYMFGTFLGLQLKAIGIFLHASDQYLMQFLEDGGVLTLVDILNRPQVKQEDKVEALHLLLVVSKAGRKYKEMICESNGVKAIAEYVSTSNTDEIQQTAWVLLESLSHGNPKYLNQVYRALIGLMTCTSPKAQQLLLSTLRTVQGKVKTAHHSVVEPLLNLLKTLQVDVQDEAVGLIAELMQSDLRPLLLSGLVALLKPSTEELHHEQGPAMRMSGSLPVFVQQAAAGKTIRFLAEDSPLVSRELLCLEVVHHLLYALGNTEHTDSQIEASVTLKHFVCSHPATEEPVHRVMGDALFAAFMNEAETLYKNIDETQAEILLLNQVNTAECLEL